MKVVSNLIRNVKAICVGIAIALLVAACVPETVHPLSDPASAKIDTRLSGLWSGNIGESFVFAHFLPKGDGEMEIVTVAREKDESAHWSVFSMFPSRVAGNDYMNVKLLVDDGRPQDQDDQGFVLCRYEVDGDGGLTVWRIDEAAAIADIEQGKVGGKVRRGKWTTNVRITAPTAELGPYVAAADPKRLFADLVGKFEPHK